MERTFRTGRSNRAFTLLEVMIALVIAAIALAAISSSHSSSVIHSAKVYRMTTAAMLMRGAVLDIEEEYHAEGFPTNDLEGRDCDLPRPYDKAFECEYDLQGMQLGEAELAAMAQGALGGAMGGEGAPGEGADGPMAGLEQLQAIPALAMLFGPGGEELLQMCSINLNNLQMSLMGITQYFPQIVQKAAEQTRKLTVRISWEEGFRNERTLEIETFIVVIPEEQQELMKALGKAEDAGLLDAPEDGLGGGAGLGVPGSGGRGGGR